MRNNTPKTERYRAESCLSTCWAACGPTLSSRSECRELPTRGECAYAQRRLRQASRPTGASSRARVLHQRLWLPRASTPLHPRQRRLLGSELLVVATCVWPFSSNATNAITAHRLRCRTVGRARDSCAQPAHQRDQNVVLKSNIQSLADARACASVEVTKSISESLVAAWDCQQATHGLAHSVIACLVLRRTQKIAKWRESTG